MVSCGEACEDQFYDTREDLSSVSDWGADCCEDCCHSASVSSRYECWNKNPESVHERRHRFLKWMGVDLDGSLRLTEESDDGFVIDRTNFRTSGLEDGCFFDQCTVSSSSTEVRVSLANNLNENFEFQTRKLNDRRDFVVNELGEDNILSRFCNLRLNQFVSAGEIPSTRAPAPSPSIQQLLQREIENARYLLDAKKTGKRGWLKKLHVGICVNDKPGAALSPISLKAATRTGMQRVRVQSSKKHSKELSCLYGGQNFSAHKGSILAMKFSPDGQYLASAGQDRIVRVWKVIDDERIDRFDIANDLSSLYFKMNPFSKLGSQVVRKEKQSDAKKLGGSSDSACVIFPPKIFCLSEKPLHEFQGHKGDVLDLSWSKNGFLLSSSVDKTVRLWQVGCNRCLRVFSHNNYVTCVNFHPLDDNHFISGSIDGKVRIWEIFRCLVVDYIDVGEIVTAVSYSPDGKGGIVGFVTGSCCFFDIIDGHLKLNGQICMQGKKKSVGKRITGFQFSPNNPSKVMVTSADSGVRVISGTKVICKYKGLRSGGNHVSASFTSDGDHIVSASEDSNVHIWNYNNHETSSSRPKNIRSCENFVSQNSVIAIPWNGVNDLPGILPSPAFIGDAHGRSSLDSLLQLRNLDERVQQKMCISSPDCFSLGRGFLLESLPKGNPTWPEEKLVNSTPTPPVPVSPTMSRSEYRFLKNACHSLSSTSHMWGLVIVTAGLDGRIRTFHNYGLPTRC